MGTSDKIWICIDYKADNSYYISVQYPEIDNSIEVIQDNVLVLRKYAMKHLRIKEHVVSNILSQSSERDHIK